MDTPAPQDLALVAADGTRLAATHFPAGGRQWLVVAGATAVPRGFYRRFAVWAQTRSLDVLTLDYRGIGGSRPPSLRGYAPDYLDWGRQDLAAAIDWASARGPVWLVGHSYGGHALGLLPDPTRVRAAWIFGGGAGWHGWMPRAERLRVLALWHVIGPVAGRILGYQPMRRLGIGEDLPLSIFRQWRRWSSFPGYFFDDPEAREVAAGFDRVRFPVAAANADDDLWALPRSRDAFFSRFRGTVVERVDLAPAARGLRAVGHMGYFRPDVGAVLWPLALAWLEAHGLHGVRDGHAVVPAAPQAADAPGLRRGSDAVSSAP